ncbi:hypothetical protein [Acinetobacter sp. Ac_5812]|uniref:hypothetical protein n=1 Tax=Acinetobacter sp. Ac_5812 TaxID=1848937 RepID=UPI0014904550|nr:hypothetical protein [Acinetobacter sp. Ac_5812]NNP68925.1 hypothetical protein [Acinetobacter sp. Ac_5812]
MSEVIGDVILPSLKIEGTAQEVAVKIFENIVSPNTEMLFKNDPQAAAVFAYQIMGLAVSQYADLVSTKHFKKHMDIVTHNLVQILKKERGELSN